MPRRCSSSRNSVFKVAFQIFGIMRLVQKHDWDIRAIIPCLAQYQQPTARGIHKTVVWSRGHSWSGGSLRGLYEIIDGLKTQLPTFPTKDSAILSRVVSVTRGRRPKAVPTDAHLLQGRHGKVIQGPYSYTGQAVPAHHHSFVQGSQTRCLLQFSRDRTIGFTPKL